MSSRRLCGIGVLSIGATLFGCQVSQPQAQGPAPASAPFAALPDGGSGVLPDPNPLPADREIADLSVEGAVARGVTEPVIIDTRRFAEQIGVTGPFEGEPRPVKVHLPPHTRPAMDAGGAVGLEDFPVGTTRSGRSVDESSIFQFSGLDRSGWVPPDPTIAVGPDHVLITVNQSIAWYRKDGIIQFSQILGSQGSPGFFEPVGAGSFTFDPKCFYDHYEGRFVVLALEVYTSTAYITIAVSDDSDPNGIWYKYRTDAVLNINGTTYWWDYPGLGYDDEAYYVTGNLFGLSANGFAGAGFRVFDKAPMLVGDPAVHLTVRDGGGASVQCAQHFGDNPSPYFLSELSGGALRIYGMENPLTSPVLRPWTVGIPSYQGAGEASVLGGGSLFIVGSRIMNVHWRDGRLYGAHAISVGGIAKPRWYEIDTNGWPSGGAPQLAQAGVADPGPGIEGFFPAIYANDAGQVAMVYGTSSSSRPVGMNVTGRQPSDPDGAMAEPVEVRLSPFGGSDGRWGDYYDLAVDPVDGLTFWAIGQTEESIGWDTRIARFSLEPACLVDLAPPAGVLDLADINAFVAAFGAGDPIADLAPPSGVLDLADISAFVEGFTAGCP